MNICSTVEEREGGVGDRIVRINSALEFSDVHMTNNDTWKDFANEAINSSLSSSCDNCSCMACFVRSLVLCSFEEIVLRL